jgi:uncharacterized membrane protein YeaQ/YmgE (transglycosylase-associated protein family)
MTTEQWITTILIGLVAGYVGGKLVRGRGYGLIINIVVGVIGAWLGQKIIGLLQIRIEGGLLSTILVACGGAVVLLLLLRAVFGNKR